MQAIARIPTNPGYVVHFRTIQSFPTVNSPRSRASFARSVRVANGARFECAPVRAIRPLSRENSNHGLNFSSILARAVAAAAAVILILSGI